ncbi:replication protein A 70 kDa DNA-binding subunit B-like [Rosa sericea]
MEEGRVYDIFRCHSRENDFPFKVIDHEAHLSFNRKTEFKQVKDSSSPIPRYAFNLLEFSELEDKKEDQIVLIDVYGCVKSIMPESQVFVRNKGKMESKCEITLENLRREDVRITLWGDNARQFDVQAVQNRSPPILAVFTSLRITDFQQRITLSGTNHTCMIVDPQIPQRQEYRKEFSKPGDKSKPVCCSAEIARFSTHNSWWYNGCPIFRKQQLRQKENSNEMSCNEHETQQPLPCYRVYVTIGDRENEATLIVMGKAAEQLFGNTCPELLNKRQYPTTQTLPKEIEDTIGQQYLFEIQPKSHGELIVKSVSPDPQNFVAVPEQHPTTATPDRPSTERKRTVETSKKALFTTEQQKKSKRQSQHQGTTSSSLESEQHETQTSR